MKRSLSSLILTISLLLTSGVLYLIVWWWPSAFGRALALSFLILGGTEFVFRVLLQRLLNKRIRADDARYNLKKTLNFLYLVTAVLLILWIWLPNVGTAVAAYGFVAAALAFALQDLFKDVVGGIVIVLRNLYRVGDRVAINNVTGDVLAVGLLYTTLLEIGAWVTGDQPTGRLIRLPNGQMLTNNVTNYTADHEYLWDEVAFTITRTSNWQAADHLLQEVIAEATHELSTAAMQELYALQETYALSDQSNEPRVYLEVVSGGVRLCGRYVVSGRRRREVHDAITRSFLERLAHEKHVDLI